MKSYRYAFPWCEIVAGVSIIYILARFLPWAIGGCLVVGR